MKIIRDTREKNGWSFGIYSDEPVIDTALKTGDYSLEGHESSICIERKASSGEIANNLRGANKDRFISELYRMKDFTAAYLICEFSHEVLLKFPEGSGIPKKLWFRTGKNGKLVRNIKLTGQYILSFLENQCFQNDIELIFCRNKSEAEQTAFEILRDYDKQIQG